MPAPTPRPTLRLLVVAAVLAAAAIPVAVPAGGQARLVNALVRTLPDRPEPGDDVTVFVNVTGCAPGDVTVELYLTTSDGSTRTPTMMARTAAVTTLLMRTKAVLQLPDALEGWYGVRVLCGLFRPPKEPMANTLFAVGPKPTKQLLLGGTTVAAGAGLPFGGDGCPGASVEYDLSEGSGRAGAFEADGTIPVAAGGTWSTTLTFPAESTPGAAQVRARCVATNQFGDEVFVYYATPARVTITAA